MTGDPSTSSEEAAARTPAARSVNRGISVVVLALLAVSQTPVASAHGDVALGGLSSGHALLVMGAGVVAIGAVLGLKRLNRLTPRRTLHGIFAGLFVTVVGAILFEGLVPDPTYTASSMPVPRSWYAPLALGVALLVVTLSFVVGLFRWTTKPRYTFLGILLGLWIAYPVLVPAPAGYSHPLGYVLVLSTPALVAYIVWTDAWDIVRDVVADPVSKRFGVGVGALVGLFFAFSTGYLSFFPDEAVPHERIMTVVPAVYQLVSWPTFEFYFPHVPIFGAVSVGMLVVIGTLSLLVALNAALVARHWRIGRSAGMTEGTAGTGAIVGSCTCGCCGPLVAKFAIVAAGPSIAAPLYWLFVDTASPLGPLFVVGSVALFTATLVYSADELRSAPSPACPSPAD